jgi:hypothetical protein
VYIADDKRYDSMQYRRSGRSGIKLPAVSLGLWHNFGGVDHFENSRAMLRRAFDLGITHFDLANNYGPPYGSAEETFGQILKKDFLPYRDELIISTKAGWDMWPGPYGDLGSRKYLLASLDQTLKRMGLAYVDIFSGKIRTLPASSVRGKAPMPSALAWIAFTLRKSWWTGPVSLSAAIPAWPTRPLQRPWAFQRFLSICRRSRQTPRTPCTLI